MNQIKAAWKGDEKLWKVFWIYNWLFGTAFGIGMDYSENFGLLIQLVVLVVVTAWLVWVVVALWRCSFNARWRGWGYVVRTLMVIGFAGLGYLLAVSPESL